MIVLLKLLFILLLLFGLLKLVQAVQSVLKWSRSRSPASEECPACGERVVLGETVDRCPECGTTLARNESGELMIRIN